MKYYRLDKNRMTAAQAPFTLSIFANEQVKIEKSAFEELDGLSHLADCLSMQAEQFKGHFAYDPCIEKVSITPDFHKGTGIPVGTSMKTTEVFFPKAMGSDIGCGMALFSINGIAREEVEAQKKILIQRLRHIFWGGGRDIPLTFQHRRDILAAGVQGLLSSPVLNKGIWEYLQKFKNVLIQTENIQQIVDASTIYNEYCGKKYSTYDSQIGSIGGGNHFVELQYVKDIKDRHLAEQAGIKRESLLIMVHSGSLSIGSTAWFHIEAMLKDAYPKGIKKPYLGFYPVFSCQEKLTEKVLQITRNAANFAAVNRLMLGLMVVKAINEVVRPVESLQMIHDGWHNLIEALPGNSYIHRKGACRSNKGEYVIIPGSMGASSFLMNGLGNAEALCSSCHGAGRALSRGRTLRGFDADFKKFMNSFTVVSSIDFSVLRPDVRKKKLEELKSEAPFAYKAITPVIETIIDAKIANPVVEFFPLMTLKN